MGRSPRRINGPIPQSILVAAGVVVVLAATLALGSTGDSGARDEGVIAAAKKKRKPIRPNPRKGRDDKPKVWEDRCEMGKKVTRIPRECAYGDLDGKTTVVLTGDSLASAYFPGINRVAKQKGWRLLSLTKVGCAPYRTLFYNNQLDRAYHECLEWHKALFKRLKQEKPGLIITMGWTLHKAWVNGKRLEPESKRSRKRIKRGYVKMLKTLRKRFGARLAVLKDTPRSPFDVGACVAEHRRHPNRHCTYRIPRSHEKHSFEGGVARKVKGAKLVDLTPVFCPKKRCRAVVDRKLVLRDRNHPTATFAKTLAKPLARRLPAPR